MTDDDIRDRVRGWTGDADTPLRPTASSRAADEEHARAVQFARAVIEERLRLDTHEPDWDAYIDNVRASYGLR